MFIRFRLYCLCYLFFSVYCLHVNSPSRRVLPPRPKPSDCRLFSAAPPARGDALHGNRFLQQVPSSCNSNNRLLSLASLLACLSRVAGTAWVNRPENKYPRRIHPIYSLFVFVCLFLSFLVCSFSLVHGFPLWLMACAGNRFPDLGSLGFVLGLRRENQEVVNPVE